MGGWGGRLAAGAVFFGAAWITGCGAAQLVLKAPLADRCESAGLKDCPELVDGALDFVQGEKDEGEKKLKHAAGENSPENVKAYARAVKAVAELPGMPSYAEPIREVAAILAGEEVARPTSGGEGDGDGDGEEMKSKRSFGAADRANALAPRGGGSETKTVAPASDRRAIACDGALVPAFDGACTRVSLLLGPFEVTDLYAPGGCPDDLFVYDDDGSGTAVWMILDPATKTLNFHGALTLRPEERLYLGSRNEKGTVKNDWMACAITVSGVRGRE